MPTQPLLTYCTNIHAGESWGDHFAAIRKYFPPVKQKVSPNLPMGMGLRLSNIASEELANPDRLAEFKRWLEDNSVFVFTMNGFPYGGFHNTRVKDDVHTPDWTTNNRVEYTIRMFHILKELLPQGLEGGISTSPLSYRRWQTSAAQIQEATEKATANILRIVEELINIERETSKILHLDIEPEPDGLLETGTEFLEWYNAFLLPQGIFYLKERFGFTAADAEEKIKAHVQLCYDVCHFAIGYENHEQVQEKLAVQNIRIGKIQISAALKASFTEANRAEIKQAFSKYNEPTYLHQIVARHADGTLRRYADLPEALESDTPAGLEEWRAHFHVPIFLEDFGMLKSTNSDIKEVLALNRGNALTSHLEVETYTWEVLPEELKLPIEESISRELLWVKDQL